jgi:HlyD family secretion protein
MSQLFRKEALDKLQSPERLNEMVQITTKKGWFALYGIAGMLAIGIIWCFMGRIPEVVKGEGMLLQPEGVTEIIVNGTGILSKINVKEGDVVKKGDVLARLSIPEMEIQISNAQKNILESKEYFNNLNNFDEKDISMRQNLLSKKEALQNNTMKSNEQLLQFYKDKITSQEALLKDGLITKETILNTRNQYFQLQQQQDGLKNEMVSVGLDMFQNINQKETELKNMRQKLNESERNMQQLKTMYALMSTIYSTATGTVIEILANQGNLLTPGTTLMRIEQTHETESLECNIYVRSTEGKRVVPGMKVKISPSTVEVEEYGFIVGTVTYVSQYPASFQGMVRILGNKDITQAFMTQGAPPISIRVSLDKSKDTYSGYQWTSGSGPQTKIKTGTICTAKIEVNSKRPIELLFIKFDKLRHSDRW